MEEFIKKSNQPQSMFFFSSVTFFLTGVVALQVFFPLNLVFFNSNRLFFALPNDELELSCKVWFQRGNVISFDDGWSGAKMGLDYTYRSRKKGYYM